MTYFLSTRASSWSLQMVGAVSSFVRLVFSIIIDTEKSSLPWRKRSTAGRANKIPECQTVRLLKHNDQTACATYSWAALLKATINDETTCATYPRTPSLKPTINDQTTCVTYLIATSWYILFQGPTFRRTYIDTSPSLSWRILRYDTSCSRDCTLVLFNNS